MRAGVGKWAFRSKHAQSACACLPTPGMLGCFVSGKRMQLSGKQPIRKGITCERVLSGLSVPSHGSTSAVVQHSAILWWITHDIPLPAAHHHAWATVCCPARSLMHSSVKYSRAVTFYRGHAYSVCLIRELGAVSGPSPSMESQMISSPAQIQTLHKLGLCMSQISR